jgi:hypothetical protein
MSLWRSRQHFASCCLNVGIHNDVISWTSTSSKDSEAVARSTLSMCNRQPVLLAGMFSSLNPSVGGRTMPNTQLKNYMLCSSLQRGRL